MCFVSWTALAGDENDRFFEDQRNGETETFDLSTVQMVSPDRFTIKSITIDDPDIIRFKLITLPILLKYCSYAEGEYRPVKALFAMGPPDDLPVKRVTVHEMHDERAVSWEYPYKRLRHQRYFFVGCNDFIDKRNEITNGESTEFQFDCKRGMMGIFLELFGERQIDMGFVNPGTVGEYQYQQLCWRVTHRKP